MDHRAGAMHVKCCGALLVALLAASVALGTTATSAPAGQDTPVLSARTADEGEYPWFAQLSITYDKTIACGGSLVGSRWVLTAANCVTHSGSYPSEILVRYNSIVHGEGAEAIGQYVHVHPLWNRETSEYDFALIELSEDVGLSHFVRLHGLDTSSSSDLLAARSAMIGFGVASSGRTSSAMLLEKDISVKADSACAGLFGASWAPKSMMCAGYNLEPGFDTCQGGSGGPLLLGAMSGGGSENRIQIGVVSRGSGCADAEYPSTLFSRVESVSEWIGCIVQRPGFEHCKGEYQLNSPLTLHTGTCDACQYVHVLSNNGWAQTGALNYETDIGGQNAASARLELGTDVAGQIELDVFVDSEEGADFLTVGLDGKEVFRASGANKSSTLALEFLPGSIVRLTYSKDRSISSNSDLARLRGVRFTPCSSCSPVALVEADGWEAHGGPYEFETALYSSRQVSTLLLQFDQSGNVSLHVYVFAASGSAYLTVSGYGTEWRGDDYAIETLRLEVYPGSLIMLYFSQNPDPIYPSWAGIGRMTFEPLLPAGLCDVCAVSVGSTDGWAQTGKGLNYGTYTCGQDGASAVLELGAAVAGQLELDVYVDSEDGADFLTVHRDGEQMYRESGAYKSATWELEVFAGSVVSLTYSKDGSVNLYADTARLTGVRFTPCASCDAAKLIVADGWQATGGPFAFETTIAGQNGESATLSLEFNQAGKVILDVFVDSEPGYDYFTVRRRGLLDWRESGSNKRATLELDVSVGTVITLTYSKDSNINTYSDKAGLSRLVFEPQ